MAPVRRWLVLVWLAALPGLTAARATVWTNNVTLWTDATWRSEKPRPWINLGAAYYETHRYAEARQALETADRTIGPRRNADEQRVSYAYTRLVQGYLAAVDGRWTKASALASDLNTRTERRWPPAVALCRMVGCS